ncbi:MAG: N-acetylmuramoyl-L-alanine amidase [Clostridia bacterium]|nr:N-acetylmuramoyl-L-alanine amidase [Clostridia bacterium]
MKKRWSRRLKALGIALLCAGALAIAPRPARPAVPARPAQTEAGPLAGQVILVDAGHGGTDGGARARDSGALEKELNLRVALLLRDALTQSGAQVIMTRETDTQFSQQKRQDLNARLDLAREGGASMLISVHMNEYRTRRESGPQVFYRQGQEQSRLLAGCVQEALIAELQPAKERAALAGDYFILSLSIPSVLVECGFLSNAAEEKLLLDPDYQARVASAIRDGVIAYVSLSDAL